MNETMFFKRPFVSIRPEDCSPLDRPAVSPSVRLRVNAANRPLLRWLRAAELTAWEEPAPAARRTYGRFNR